MHLMQRLLISYRVFLFLAPSFDQAHVSGGRVTGGDASDNRFVQLKRNTGGKFQKNLDG